MATYYVDLDFQAGGEVPIPSRAQITLIATGPSDGKTVRLSPPCVSEAEIDNAADALIGEIEEIREQAKRKIAADSKRQMSSLAEKQKR